VTPEDIPQLCRKKNVILSNRSFPIKFKNPNLATRKPKKSSIKKSKTNNSISPNKSPMNVSTCKKPMESKRCLENLNDFLFLNQKVTFQKTEFQF
jgi:hypothetical protein